MVKCPKCGEESEYVEEYKRYYCLNCEEYLPEQTPPPPKSSEDKDDLMNPELTEKSKSSKKSKNNLLKWLIIGFAVFFGLLLVFILIIIVIAGGSFFWMSGVQESLEQSVGAPDIEDSSEESIIENETQTVSQPVIDFSIVSATCESPNTVSIIGLNNGQETINVEQVILTVSDGDGQVINTDNNPIINPTEIEPGSSFTVSSESTSIEPGEEYSLRLEINDEPEILTCSSS